MREFQPWMGEDEIEESFSDIDEYSRNCRFRNCTHESEPGCAVQEAIRRGELDSGRYKNFTRMKREARFLEERISFGAQQTERKRWKAITKLQRQFKKGY
jgi:ribosome biogenesis GTPase